MPKKRLSTQELCLIGVLVAILAVLSQVSIPMPYGVPMTLQTFVLPLAGMILGRKNGTLAVVIYIFLGAVGAPVFAGFSGGLSVLLGGTGGFLLSFPAVAFTAGLGMEKGKKGWLVFWLIIGCVINYICGMLYFSLVLSASLKSAFMACVIPFIPTAVIKLVLSALLGWKLHRIFRKAGLIR